jgi:hypothetical protein
MFPMAGLLLIFIPVGGFLLALLLCFVKQLRFLATFAFFVPLVGAYSAFAGFWAFGIAIERAGLNRWVVALSCWLGLLGGGAIGSVLGLGIAFGLGRVGRHLLLSYPRK